MTTQHIVDPRTLAHRRDPDTSLLAAERHVESGANDAQCDRVLGCLRQYVGCTSAELSEHFKLDRSMVARRLPDLVKLGLARQGAKRDCTVKGTKSVTWWPTDGGEQ